MKVAFVIMGIVAIILFFAFKKKKPQPVPVIPTIPTGPIAASFNKVAKPLDAPVDKIVNINWKLFKKRYFPGLFPEPVVGESGKGTQAGISPSWLFWTWGFILLVLAGTGIGFYYGNTIREQLQTQFITLVNNLETAQTESNNNFNAFKTSIDVKLKTAEQNNTEKINKRLDEISKAQEKENQVLTDRFKEYVPKAQIDNLSKAALEGSTANSTRLQNQQASIAKLQSDIANIKNYNDTDIKNQLSSMRTEFEGRIRDLTIQAQATPMPTPANTVNTIYITQESYMSGENDSVQVFGNQFVGQTYTPIRSVIIDKIRIRLQKVDLLAYGAVTVGIVQTDANGYPASGYLTSGLIQTASMNNTPNTYEADLDDILLNGGTTYLILIKALGAPEAKLSVMVANPGSAPGFMVVNPGGVWQQYVNKDLMFEIVRR